jgi:tetratricopeptide (TPR) repeat protein
VITLSAFGRFKLVDESGYEVTPRGMRARALIALLALAPGHRRARVWLQDKLWSERSAKQGSESLRQALTEIRRSFGTHASVLIADRESVGLDASQFTVQLNGDEHSDLEPADLELFADLNVPDQEFEQWIRERRSAFASTSREAPRPTSSATKIAPAVFFCVPSNVEPGVDMAIGSLLALMTTSLLDFADFQIFQPNDNTFHSGLPPERGMVVKIVAGGALEQIRLHMTISDVADQRIFWSRTFRLSSNDMELDEAAFKVAALETVEAILSAFRTWNGNLAIGNCAALLVNRARQSIFRFDKHNLRQADRYLAQAYGYDGRPQILAWRAFVRNIANFQHRSTAFLSEQIDIKTLAQEALLDAPGSAISLGVRAHIEYLSGGSQRSSLLLARRAVEADPLNALNHAILSNTELALGDLGGSRASSLTALSLSGSGEYRSFVEFFCCMSAAAEGDYDQATDHAEAALLLRPSFVAPLRYLIALYKHAGRREALQRVLALMRVNEPDFRLERLLDNDYPVNTLRRIRLIEAIDR